MGKTILGTTNFFKEEQERFNWFGKEIHKGYVKSDKDVTINTVYKTRADKLENKNPYISMSFRNGVRHLFADNEYALVAVVKNRIFFKESDAEHGLLVRQQKTQAKNAKSYDNGYLRIGDSNAVESIIPFVGSYDLKWDKFYELYYVEKEENEE